MNLRRTAVCAFVLLALGTACEAIIGLDDHDYRVAEAGTVVDPCMHARPPKRPDVPDDYTFYNDQYVFAISHLDYAGHDEQGNVIGYDLDESCTCGPKGDSGTAHDAAPSCVAPPNAEPGSECDGDGGVDNAMASIIARLSGLIALLDKNSYDIDDALNKGSRCGAATELFIIGDYNGQADDPTVSFSAVTAVGIYKTVDGGPPPDAGSDPVCGSSVDQPTFKARLDGQDIWDVEPGKIKFVGDAAIPQGAISGYVSDFQLVFEPSEGPPLPFVIGPRSVSLGRPLITAKLVPLGEDGGVLEVKDKKIQSPTGRAASFRIDRGFVAGRGLSADVLAAMGVIRLSTGAGDAAFDGNYLCASPLFSALRAMICRTSDSVLDPSRDFKGDTCDSLSIGGSFSAVAARIGSEGDAGQFRGDCGDNRFHASCAEN